MNDVYTYPVDLRWEGGKVGLGEASGQVPPLRVAAPPEFGGPEATWTPEHLFVLAAASCLMTTFLAIADASRLEVAAYGSAAVGTLTRGEDRRYSFTEIRLRPRIGLTRDEDRERAERLIAKAEAACLITRSIRSRVVVEPVWTIGAPAADAAQAPTAAG